MENKQIYYLDVKTVHANWDGNKKEKVWNNFIDYEQKNYIKGEIDLFEDGEGARLWHNMKSSRSKMLNYTLELEKKFEYVKKDSNTYCFMIFCGNGFDWKLDQLEDFVDYYKIGFHRSDDHFSKIECYENKSLIRNISDILFFEREFFNIYPKNFYFKITGPRDYY